MGKKKRKKKEKKKTENIHGKCGGKSRQLNPHKQPYGSASVYLLQRVRFGCKLSVTCEEEKLCCDAVGLEGLHTHDEEQTREHTLGDEVEYDEERARHGAKGEEALGKVGDALFDDVGCFVFIVAFGVGAFASVGHNRGHAKRLGVEWRLGDETIGEGETEESGYACGESEEKEIPVEAGRFLQRELSSLCDEGRD